MLYIGLTWLSAISDFRNAHNRQFGYQTNFQSKQGEQNLPKISRIAKFGGEML